MIWNNELPHHALTFWHCLSQLEADQFGDDYCSGQYGSKGQGKQDGLSESQSTDLQNAEYVLTYEDKDGDWMLVGDVPWR